uniref:Uncharacterized protein n=1 Tax=Arundo donax TaxID=35708 RepID=A0A0A9AX23_ARUDO
MDWPVAVN